MLLSNNVPGLWGSHPVYNTGSQQGRTCTQSSGDPVTENKHAKDECIFKQLSTIDYNVGL